MLISKDWKIKDIQNEFQNHFPFLKIEFYKSRKDSSGSNVKIEKLSPFIPVISMNSTMSPFEFPPGEDKKVSDLKQLFKDTLDCNIVIFRKSGNHWIETSFTEDWTLKQQNEEGKLMSEV
jgi:hypothetical protein